MYTIAMQLPTVSHSHPPKLFDGPQTRRDADRRHRRLGFGQTRPYNYGSTAYILTDAGQFRRCLMLSIPCGEKSITSDPLCILGNAVRKVKKGESATNDTDYEIESSTTTESSSSTSSLRGQYYESIGEISLLRERIFNFESYDTRSLYALR